MTITYDERNGRLGANFIGVWVDGKPAGRIRPHHSGYRAYTNKLAPGSAYIGTFRTQDRAGAAVAEVHADASF